MTKNIPVGFWVRTLAGLIDLVIFITIHSLFWVYIASSNLPTEVISRLALYLVLIVLPQLVFGFLYGSLLVHFLGATLGKLACGLKVTNENGKLLTLKRALFRQTVGYSFSGLFFGLGFLSIAKDPHKLAWHDKAVGSKVVINKKLWPLGLAVLVILFAINVYLTKQSVQNWANNNLTEKFIELLLVPGNIKFPNEPPSTARG